MPSNISTCMLVDRISVPSKRTVTDAGQMHVPCKFARTGAQIYTAGQLGLVDVDPKQVVTVFRDEKDVFDSVAMESFRSAPVTLGHPKKDGKPIPLTAENSKELQVGMLEGMPVRDEDTLGGILILTAKEAIDALESGTQELSAGYTCDIHLEDDKYYQRNIRANHIAIVDKGRAGSSCRISDEALELEEGKSLLAQNLLDELQPKLILSDEKIIALTDELTASKAEVATLKQLLVDLKTASEETEISLEKMKVELADAKLAAEEGVIERCNAIENARLIADMRDLGSKSVSEIYKMVVEDQMPDKNLEGKSEAYIAAMFDILVDASKGETPMSKLLKKHEEQVHVTVKPTDPVAEARQRMIQRNKTR